MNKPLHKKRMIREWRSSGEEGGIQNEDKEDATNTNAAPLAFLDIDVIHPDTHGGDHPKLLPTGVQQLQVDFVAEGQGRGRGKKIQWRGGFKHHAIMRTMEGGKRDELT